MKPWFIALKIGLGLASLTCVVIFLAQMVGVLPDPFLAERMRRTAICESLAIHCSLAAQRDDREALQEIARTAVARNADIAFLSLEERGGAVLLATGDPALADASQPGTMRADVPVSLQDRPWGHVRVVFLAPERLGWTALAGDPSLRLAMFVGVLGFPVYFGYGLLLVRRLMPASSSLIPERVRDTLDTFTEGVLVMDKEQRIAYANKAFCSLSGESNELLAGNTPARLPWTAADPFSSDWPWTHALQRKESQRQTLGLRNDSPIPRTLAVQATPIEDDSGAVHGALATFDDLTTIEKMNARLRRLLDMLRRSRARINRQNRELHHLSTVDPLTGCLNRREFYVRTNALFASARRYNHTLSYVMVDVDHFKSVNDKFGHAMGDKVLVDVAAALRAAVRESDVVCRMGGEEFCIVLPHTDLYPAWEAGERFRKIIANLKFDELVVTVSMGVSSASLGAESSEKLLEQADHALYAAKQSGRNRVVTFPEISTALSETSAG